MANDFSKEEIVAFEETLEGFEDWLVLSKAMSKYSIGQVQQERTNDTIWRPMPYIMRAKDGITQNDAAFGSVTQLSVPTSLGYHKVVPWEMSATELRDSVQEGRIASAAQKALASEINLACGSVAANQGTIVVAQSGAATGFDDVAELDTKCNELGIPMDDRNLFLASREYNAMASNLAARSTMTGKPTTAYEKAIVGEVSSFTTHKLGYSPRLTAFAGTTVTVNGANQYYTPAATSTATTGETSNVDNRSQNLTIAVGGGTVKIGDAFTIAGVNEVHHITKVDTGQLKTFRITDIVSGAGGSGVVKVSPAIVSNGGATDAEAQYQNVTATPADGAAITFLNTTTANVNPFWYVDAFEVIGGSLVVPSGAGLSTMSGSTENGIGLLMSKTAGINSLETKIRFDVTFGVVCKQPEMAGIQLFGQV